MLQNGLAPRVVILWACLIFCRAQDFLTTLADPANQWAPTTTISTPDSQGFVDATLRWDIYAPPTYSVAISPGTESDVRKAVELATSHNVPFLATDGRHGYTTTLGSLHGGLAIDLSKLDSVVVDAESGTVVVGGGALVSQIPDPVYNAGFEIQTITSQCPGMLGSTLGAGVGRDEGRYGLMIDALESVRLVTADARLIEVSETSNSDLFWAIRGAGANFGVVTSATYRLHAITDTNRQVTSIDMMIPMNMSSEFFETIVSSFNGSLPPLLAAETLITYDAASNAPLLLSNWVYYGPESEAQEVLAPILDLKPPVVATTVVPWSGLLDTVLFGSDQSNCVKNRSASLFGVNMRSMSAPTYQNAVGKMAQFYADDPNGRGSILTLEMFPNQAAIAIPDSATAYPWRETIASLLIIMVDPDDEAEELAREIRSDFAATSGYPELAVYVSYAHGDESLEQIYGSTKLPRLTALKKEWDPSNVFGFNNPIPTSYP
ncbi:hypothetical protein GGR51DRAFT_546059 [Nemania sp. FL0031]|nr:hypothetical protein GGR51DRAFT_546059 [Nemania sp. FL0031]